MTSPLHAVLVRQLRRLQLDPTCVPTPEQWRQLLDCVSRAYAEADQDRYTLERSIEVSAAEMRELYEDLAGKHAALLAHRQRIHAIFEHSAVGQVVIDERGVCIESNHALSIMIGSPSSEIVGRELLDLLDSSERAGFSGPLSELLAGDRQELAAEQSWPTGDGRRLWVNVTLSLVESSGAQPRFAAAFVQDITDRKRLEIELRHAQKLESVGRLAAGIAHEINTPVQFLGDNLPFFEEAAEANRRLRARFRELLMQAVASDSVRASDIELAEQETDMAYIEEETPRALLQTREGLARVANIVRAMKDFAHPDAGEAIHADINRALVSTITVASGEIKQVAEVVTSFAELPLVPCSLGDLSQAFLNILVNAAHAIGDVVGSSGRVGTICVRTALEGDNVLISISDNGVGMSEAQQARVFEPFFTTKEVGRGTGQGLTLARGVVVDRHSGQLSFRSRMGEGTTFEIRLPLHGGPKKRAVAP